MTAFVYVAYGVFAWVGIAAFFIGLVVGSQLTREARDD